MNTKKWRLEGYDTFDRSEYPLPGEYDTQAAAELGASAYLDELERTQPTSQSGGQFGGIQDRVYVIPPDGSANRAYRYTKTLPPES